MKFLRISNYNWSGNNILFKREKDNIYKKLYQTMITLNKTKINIWMKVEIKFLKEYANKLVKNTIFIHGYLIFSLIFIIILALLGIINNNILRIFNLIFALLFLFEILIKFVAYGINGNYRLNYY